MAEKVIVNESNSLNWRDVGKSWILIVGIPVVMGIIELIDKDGSFANIEWGKILTGTVTATLLFLVQRYKSQPSVVTFYNSNEKAVAVGEDIEKKNA